MVPKVTYQVNSALCHVIFIPLYLDTALSTVPNTRNDLCSFVSLCRKWDSCSLRPVATWAWRSMLPLVKTWQRYWMTWETNTSRSSRGTAERLSSGMKSRYVAKHKVESPSVAKPRHPGTGHAMPLAKRRWLLTCISLAQLGEWEGKSGWGKTAVAEREQARVMCKGGSNVRVYGAMTRLSSMRTGWKAEAPWLS